MKVKFVYSYPYERTLLKLANKKLTKEHNERGQAKTKVVQKIWDKYEKKVQGLFRQMYKIDIPEKFLKVYISLVAPNSYSNPMTISLRNNLDLEKSSKSERIFVYTLVHELAHYFAYTRDKKQFFNKLLKKIKNADFLDGHGAKLHYLIQAVEFGIGSKLFGKDRAQLRRDWIIENWKNNEYGKSAALLKEHNVPLDKTCLEFITKEILNKNSF